jgi:Na+/melibiose symporter-like transporter
MVAIYLYLTLYLQNYLGHTPLEAGVRYLPITVTAFLVSVLAGALLSRVPSRSLLATGLLLAGSGLLLMGGLEATSEWTALLGGFILAGAGVGLLNPVIADVAMSVVPKERSGMAAGINDTFRQVGVAVGIAAWGALFLGRGADRAAEVAAGTPGAEGDRPRELVEAASAGNLDAALAEAPPSSRETLEDAAREGFLTGLNDVLTIGAGLALAGAVLAFWLVREAEIERAPARGLEPATE